MDLTITEDRCHLIAGHRRLRFSFFLDEPRPGVGDQRSVSRDEQPRCDVVRFVTAVLTADG
jgi:hypothetical protein